ncbi:putative rod shape-determining protein mreB [Burkholderia pseudomallei MSHR332]|nr:putative rod shape-determining protein mreB [Burkholderia pseudomallei MSHR332]
MAAPFLGRFFAHNVAVDPGTASTLIYVRNRGVVLNQPSVVCFRKRGGPAERARVEAVGEQAKALLGRSPSIWKPSGRSGTASSRTITRPSR